MPATAAGSSAGVAQAAVVTARLTERADLWGENGKRADSYSSTYRVRRTPMRTLHYFSSLTMNLSCLRRPCSLTLTLILTHQSLPTAAPQWSI